jgi:hypothetical protein
MSQKTSNHAKAPEAAKFVEHMREVFGEVKVLYVKEGNLELGECGESRTEKSTLKAA